MRLDAQQVSTTAPLPDDPSQYPVARLVPPPPDPDHHLSVEADHLTRKGDLYTLNGHIELTYNGYIVHADHATYDDSTGDLTADGHLKLEGGPDDEVIEASHGTANLNDQTGRFYDVNGSIGLRSNSNSKNLYRSTANPFLFSGRIVVKQGRLHYDIYNGSFTSCQLPNPDWQLLSSHFSIQNGFARASNSIFRLLDIPILFLPYVTHPVEVEQRQTGFKIPVIGHSSTKGLVLGEEFYITLGRSADMTLGSEYYSNRGFSQMANFRYKGSGQNFLTARYSGLLDRGYTPTGGVYTNQGGEDFLLTGRKDFDSHTRISGDVEYLSSYVYREAFTDNFNQAVSTDIVSKAYAFHQSNGFAVALYADRYQGLKNVVTGQQVHILHVPSLDFDAIEHPLGTTGLQWSLSTSATGLKRSQQGFVTGGIVERIDFHPHLSYPIHFDGWNIHPSVAVRDTFYSRSRVNAPIPGPVPVQVNASTNRADFETEIEVRPPVLERTFQVNRLTRLFGSEMKHAIEPSFTYHYVTGVNNFDQILRFDATDIVSNTNEIEYGVTQRFFFRKRNSTVCDEETRGDTSLTSSCASMPESIRWRVAQKYFFDPTFGGLIQNLPNGQPNPANFNRRNIFDTTLDFTGIAFVTQPRSIAPLLSELRIRASNHTDIEWDVNYDTGGHRFTASNVFIDEHVGDYFTGLSYARLNAPGRFLSISDTTTTGAPTAGTNPNISDFSQLRLLVGYGKPTKPGFSLAANTGLDLNALSMQYAAVQSSYNWKCCGLSVEYRKFELGPVRNESVERFSFTLVNIGSAGNLRHAERLF